MKKLLESLKNKFYYSAESIKNRYPCKIVSIKDHLNFNKKSTITYQAVTKLNLRKCYIDDLLEDPLITEKFHPTECIKFGFLAAGEILLKNELSMEEAKDLYKKIISEMFNDAGENN